MPQPPQPSKTSIDRPSGPSAPQQGPNDSNRVASHIHEFGDVDERVVHLVESDESDREEHVPVYGARASAELPSQKPRRRTAASRALARLFRRRELMQYFYNDVLFRTKQGRRVSREELFLDLVLVAAIALLGHYLREKSITWPHIETFLLLFFVIYSAWRQIVLLWNYWGVKEDMYDKIGIYFTFVFIVGISFGAYKPFTEDVRLFVSLSAFFAAFTPTVESFLWSRYDPLLKIPANRVNRISLGCLASTVALVPLLVAAFIPSERAAKNLFWVSIIMQLIALVAPTYVVRYMHRHNSMYSRPALSIEHIAEKFEVLTMIFMGEVVIALLSEGAPLVAQEGARKRRLYFAGFLSTAMLYSFQTLYIQVDNRILRRGMHAMRYDALRGTSWAGLHMPYHLSLVLMATGLGLLLRDVAFAPKALASGGGHGEAHAAEHLLMAAVARAGGAEVKPGVEQFTRAARWLFSVGWGSSMICSALLSVSHVGGPRAATKMPRLAARCAAAVALMVGMPFSNLVALNFLGVFTAAAAFFAIAEFLLVQLDRIGLFRSEPTPQGSAEALAAQAAADESAESAPGGAQYEAQRADGVNAGGADDDDDGDSSDLMSELEGELSEGESKELSNLDDALRNMRAPRRGVAFQSSEDIEAAGEGAETPAGSANELPEPVARALQRRLTRGNTSRLVAVQKSDAWHKRRHGLG